MLKYLSPSEADLLWNVSPFVDCDNVAWCQHNNGVGSTTCIDSLLTGMNYPTIVNILDEI